MRPVRLFCSAPPKLAQEEKDPAHTASFGVELKEHGDAHQVPCELVYPGAPNVKHATDNDYIKAHLRPELR